jgi:hypothetical protein
MKAEIDQKEYSLVKTPLAREVYLSLMGGNEESAPQSNWQGRLQQIFLNNNVPPPQAMVIGAPNDRQLQADTSSAEQHTEGELLPQSEQEPLQGEEEVQSQ